MRSASFLPPVSLSGHRINSLPCSGEKSNCGAVFLVSAPAPPIVHVAVYPARLRASAHFSPSTHTTRSDASMLGILYSGLMSGNFEYGEPSTNGRNSFFGLPFVLSIGLPAMSFTLYLRTVTSTSPSALVYTYSASYGELALYCGRMGFSIGALSRTISGPVFSR